LGVCDGTVPLWWARGRGGGGPGHGGGDLAPAEGGSLADETPFVGRQALRRARGAAPVNGSRMGRGYPTADATFGTVKPTALLVSGGTTLSEGLVSLCVTGRNVD